MNNKKIVFVATLAFALGFYASEYRHAKNDKNAQPIVAANIDEPDETPVATRTRQSVNC
jgi:type IV secretory pathway VirB10-like protein